MTSRLAFAFLIAIAIAPKCAGAESVAASCPAYPAHLRSAREHLARGDRKGAVDELHRADEALASCLREEAGGGSLLAEYESRIRSS